VPPCDRLPRIGQHLVPVLHFVRSALRAENDPSDLVVATEPVVIQDVDFEARIAHLLQDDVKHQRLVELRRQSPFQHRSFLLLNSAPVLNQPDLHVRICASNSHFTFWVSPFAQRNSYVFSQASRSNYHGYLHVLKYLLLLLLLLYLSRKELCRRIGKANISATFCETSASRSFSITSVSEMIRKPPLVKA